jgi:hypothetical protein
VSEIVQQGGHHGGIFFASLLCQMGTLQSMLTLTHGLAPVLLGGTRLEQFNNISSGERHEKSLLCKPEFLSSA